MMCMCSPRSPPTPDPVLQGAASMAAKSRRAGATRGAPDRRAARVGLPRCAYRRPARAGRFPFEAPRRAAASHLLAWRLRGCRRSLGDVLSSRLATFRRLAEGRRFRLCAAPRLFACVLSSARARRALPFRGTGRAAASHLLAWRLRGCRRSLGDVLSSRLATFRRLAEGRRFRLCAAPRLFACVLLSPCTRSGISSAPGCRASVPRLAPAANTAAVAAGVVVDVCFLERID